MTLLIDTFWTEFQERLVPLGWVLTEGSRYDPTHLYGVTPGGKVFEFHAVENEITIVVGSRSRKLNKNRSDWETGTQMVGNIIAAYASLPPSWL